MSRAIALAVAASPGLTAAARPERAYILTLKPPTCLDAADSAPTRFRPVPPSS